MNLAVLLTLPWSTALAAPDPTPPPDSAVDAGEEAPSAGIDQASDPAVIEEGFLSKTLDSGLTVSIYSNPALPVVATQTWVHVGSAHEADNELGFAHLFEHLMFGATDTHDADTYGRHHMVHGGSNNAYVKFDETVYISTISPEGHDRVLQLEADRLSNLVLSADNLAREKKVVTEELRMRMENNPMSRMAGATMKAVFGDHPYSHMPSGTKATVMAADLDLVKRFYEGYYHPANMHLVIVGPVSGPETMAKVENLYAELDKTHLEPRSIPAFRDQSFPERVTLKEDLPPLKIAGQVYWGPREGDPEYAAWTMMTSMLTSGSVSPLERVLVHEQNDALETLIMPGDMQAGSVLAFGSVSLAWRRTSKAFGSLGDAVDGLGSQGWLTAENLESTRKRLLHADLKERYIAAEIAENIGRSYRRTGDAKRGLGGNASALEAVTLAQVEAAWQTWILDVEPMEVMLKKGKAIEVEADANGGAQ
jgi:zinc protease